MSEEHLDRRRFLTTIGTGAAVAVAGCSGQSDSTSTSTDDGSDDQTDGATTQTDDGSDEESTGSNTLQLDVIQRQTLDPVGVSGGASAVANWQMHEQLVAFENGLLPPVNRLAADYSLSDDNRTYTFQLKEDVTFHNGDELTAGDVVYSFKRLAESENARGNTSQIIGSTFTIDHETNDNDEYVPGSLAVEAVDETTFEMTLAQPFHSALESIADIAFSIVPENIVGDIEGYDGRMDYQTYATEELPGTGPFQFSEWEQGQEIVLSAYDDYHGSAPNIDGITYAVISDPNALYNRAMNRNLDIFEIPETQFDPSLRSIEDELDGGRKVGTYGPVRNDETLSYGEVTLLQTDYILFNTLRVEKAARQAMAYVLNQEALVADVYKGLGTPAYHLTPPVAYPGGTEAYNTHAREEYPYGYGETLIDEAATVMEEAGYSQSDMYETTLTYYSDENASAWETIAGDFQSKLASAHIDLQLEPAPSTTVTERAGSGDFDMFGTYNELGWAEADSTLRYVRPTQYTWTQWGQGDTVSEAAQTADEAWSRYQENTGPGEDAQEVRNDVYVTLEEMNWEDVTELPLIHNVETRFAYDDVENLDMHSAMYAQLYNDIELNR